MYILEVHTLAKLGWAICSQLTNSHRPYQKNVVIRDIK